MEAIASLTVPIINREEAIKEIEDFKAFYENKGYKVTLLVNEHCYEGASRYFIQMVKKMPADKKIQSLINKFLEDE